MSNFLNLYEKVHILHHRTFNTWLSAWQDRGIHYLKLGDENEFSSSNIEKVYEIAYSYMIELNKDEEDENEEFRKGWDSYKPEEDRWK